MGSLSAELAGQVLGLFGHLKGGKWSMGFQKNSNGHSVWSKHGFLIFLMVSYGLLWFLMMSYDLDGFGVAAMTMEYSINSLNSCD